MEKTILVRKHKRRVRSKIIDVKSHGRKVYIGKHHRGIFEALAKQPYEVGGQLGFKKGSLDSTKLFTGQGDEIEFEWDPNYKISFHTHPDIKGSSIMPSYDDIHTMKQVDEKGQVIFHKNNALSVSGKAKFNNVDNREIKKVSDSLQRDYEMGIGDKELFNKYQPIFDNKLGLKMGWHSPKQDITLDWRH